MASGQRRARASAVLFGLLLAAALAQASGAPRITPSDIDTCSNSTTDTSLQITRVQTCARAAVSGEGVGSAFAFASSQARVMHAASNACGSAVAGSIGELCGGADPLAVIFNAARTCAAGLAALYSHALTGSAVFDPSATAAAAAAAAGSATKEGRLQACGSTCANAQGAAQAFAQAAACGVGAATDACMAATATVTARGFAQAFVKSAAESWSKACTQGSLGGVLSGGDTIAAAASGSIARALAAVAAQACAGCPTCKCRQLPSFFSLTNAGDFSEAAATFAGSRVGLARSLAAATTSFCGSDGSEQSAEAQAGTVMATYADMLLGAAGAARGYAHAWGNGSWACGSSSVTADLMAMKEVSAEVFADAAAVTFNAWCPRAAAKLSEVQLLSGDTLARMANASAQHCASGGNASSSGQSWDLLGVLQTSNKGFTNKLADALKEAKKCGCSAAEPRAVCAWCTADTPANATRSSSGSAGGSSSSRVQPGATAAAPAAPGPAAEGAAAKPVSAAGAADAADAADAAAAAAAAEGDSLGSRAARWGPVLAKAAGWLSDAFLARTSAAPAGS